jgi:hypothetical protein
MDAIELLLFRMCGLISVVVKVLPEMRRRQRRRADIDTPTTHTERYT